MSREQQIERTACFLFEKVPPYNLFRKEECISLAKDLYDAGYRKQSEWISVDERLPQNDDRVLVYIHSERSYTMLDTDRILDGKWVRWGEDVTHWMPLPQPPERKEQP